MRTGNRAWRVLALTVFGASMLVLAAGCAEDGRPGIFRVAQASLKREADGTRFRLLGVGLGNLAPAVGADPASLIDVAGDKRAAAERAMDKIRAKFGGEAVGTGRAFKKPRA